MFRIRGILYLNPRDLIIQIEVFIREEKYLTKKEIEHAKQKDNQTYRPSYT